MKPVRSIFLYFSLLLVISVTAAGSALYIGIYNVSALQQHTGAMFALLEYARVKSITIRSQSNVPILEHTDWQTDGVALYVKHCQQCHGAPGIAPDAFSMGMLPAPSPIIKIARTRPAEEIYWAITHGIKMSGMPAWKYRLNEEQRWELVALIKQMMSFNTRQYANLRDNTADAPITEEVQPPKFSIQDQKERLKLGRIALQQYNCSGCHEIPGIVAAEAYVGPSLQGLERRIFLAGLLPVNPANVKKWIQSPQAIKPGTAMPDLHVPEEHAEWMVEYLFSDAVNRQ